MRRTYNFLADHLENRFRFDARYFLRGGFWLTLSQAITILFGITTTALLAHYLSEANYGVYRYLLSIAALFSVFSLTGLGQAVLQAAAKKYFHFYLETLKTNFLYSLLITLFSLIGASYYWFNENNTLAIGCLLVALIQPLINTFQLTPVFLLGSQRYKESTLVQTIKTTIVALATIGVIFLTENILWLFFAYLFSSLLAGYIIHRTYRPALSTPTPSDIKQTYLSYAKHTSVRNVIAGIANRLDTIVVFTQLGAVELAVYSIATVIPEQIKGSFKNLADLILPKYANKDFASIKQSLLKRSFQLFLVFLLITIVYILATPILYGFLFPKYEDAVFYSQILALSFPSSIAILYVSLLQVKKEEKKLYYFNILSTIINICLLFMFTFYFGLLGAIISKTVTRYVSLIILIVID